MRSIKKVHNAEYRPIADLITYSPVPSQSLEHLDPFLFLNHHGPQVYSPNNQGLPFGPHPHRGMETVTFILEGDIMHKDSSGHQSVIEAGGIQWMTAGSGLIHSEVSSEKFLKDGGDMEILQLWLNLPSNLKMTEPQYVGLQKDDIPLIQLNDKTQLQLISGKFEDQEGAINSLTSIFMSVLHLKSGAECSFSISEEHEVFFYMVRGAAVVNETSVKKLQLVQFDQRGTSIDIKADEDTVVILGHGTPFNEPIVASGPFVMNSTREIQEAYADYSAGKFGTWKG
ncbi:pirin family protein [bacterium]|nr:pirin family protein [bacterium]